MNKIIGLTVAPGSDPYMQTVGGTDDVCKIVQGDPLTEDLTGDIVIISSDFQGENLNGYGFNRYVRDRGIFGSFYVVGKGLKSLTREQLDFMSYLFSVSNSEYLMKDLNNFWKPVKGRDTVRAVFSTPGKLEEISMKPHYIDTCLLLRGRIELTEIDRCFVLIDRVRSHAFNLSHAREDRSFLICKQMSGSIESLTKEDVNDVMNEFDKGLAYTW